MNDLISRKALLAEYDRLHIGEPGQARTLIADAPSVDAPHWATEQAYKNGYEAGKPKWISVTERLPEDGGEYLVAVKFKFDWEKEYTYGTDVATFSFECGDIDDCWYTYNDWYEGQQYIHVTHWMQLPEPPKGE